MASIDRTLRSTGLNVGWLMDGCRSRFLMHWVMRLRRLGCQALIAIALLAVLSAGSGVPAQAADHLTEHFDSLDTDLTQVSILLRPDGSADGYSACIDPVTDFPTDRNGGTRLYFPTSPSSHPVTLVEETIPLYGVSYSQFEIVTNGTITFGPDLDPLPSLAAHFGQPRVSGLFTDELDASYGEISWKLLSDRVAVTFEDVFAFFMFFPIGNNSFQIELFFDGRIRLTYLESAVFNGLAGISEGLGVPGGFLESDLSSYPACTTCDGEIEIETPVVGCNTATRLTVRDADLAGLGVKTTQVTSSGGDSETLVLLENAGNPGLFEGQLVTSAGAVVQGDGILQVGDADVLTASYEDLSSCLGATVPVESQAQVDCVAPSINNLAIQNLTPISATLAFDTPERATAVVKFGIDCSDLPDVANGAVGVTSHAIAMKDAFDLEGSTNYFYTVEVVDLYGNTLFDDNGGLCYSFTTPERRDYFTEDFGGIGDLDLVGQSLMLLPDASLSGYTACIDAIGDYPTDPDGGTILTLGSNFNGNANQLVSPVGETVSLYGVNYSEFYVGTNGYITFTPDNTSQGTLANHFSLPRIAGLFEGLDPGPGHVSVRQLPDRIAVTWDDSSSNFYDRFFSFQTELFFDGRIRLSHKDLDIRSGPTVGLSEGLGLPSDFRESNLSGEGGSPLPNWVEPVYASCTTCDGEVRIDPILGCANPIVLQLRDSDLAGTGSHAISLTSSGGDSESAVLTEAPINPGLFEGSVPTSAGPPTPSDGVLQVADGDTVTASYAEAATCGGPPASIDSVGSVDCTSPTISGVTTTNIVATQATVTFLTPEAASGIVRYATSCAAVGQSLYPFATGPFTDTAHSIDIGGLLAGTTYYYAVTAIDGVGGTDTDDASGLCYSFSTPAGIDSLTEWFDDDNDLENQSILFRPDGGASGYSACLDPASEFPTDPSGGTVLPLFGSSDSELVTLSGATVPLYGQSYASFYVNSGGNLAFVQDNPLSVSPGNHFNVPRVSPLFHGLSPIADEVSWRQLSDRVAVTFDAVASTSSNGINSFQTELFFDGRIRITHLDTEASDGTIVGLSAGLGTPVGFVESDVSAYPSCTRCDGTIEIDSAPARCDAQVSLVLRDADLQGSGSQAVVVTSSAGDSESVLLTESPQAPGTFEGSLATTAAASPPADGQLEVADTGTVTATYADAADCSASPAVAVSIAAVDCTAPAIQNLLVSAVDGVSATVGFDTPELAQATVEFGRSCAVLSESVDGEANLSLHGTVLVGLTPNTTYYYVAKATDLAGNTATDDNAGACHTFTTTDHLQHFTENYSSAFLDVHDLENRSLLLRPDGSISYYEACQEAATAFPTDPTGGRPVLLANNSSEPVDLVDQTLSLYGTSYGTVYVGSNGYITYDDRDFTYFPLLASHFDQPRVATLFETFDPSLGGSVSWRQLSDRLAVTYEDIPHQAFGSTPEFGSNSFQFELFFDGRIRLTYLDVSTAHGIAGISEGLGTPPGFVETQWASVASCISCEGEIEIEPEAIRCDSSVPVVLRDSDLAGLGTQMVTLESSGGDIETALLVESASEPGRFEGALPTSIGAPVVGDGTVQLADGESLEARYADADDCSASPVVEVDLVSVDCLTPMLTAVAASNIGGSGATITLTVSEAVRGEVQYGVSCGALTGSAEGRHSVAPFVELTQLAPDTTYFYSATATDAAGNAVTDDNGGQCHSFTTSTEGPTDYFVVELVVGGANDLSNGSLLLTPDGSSSQYAACQGVAPTFPTDPTGGAEVTSSNPELVTLVGETVSFYGNSYDSFYVSRRWGNITFNQSGASGSSFERHFELPRISVLSANFEYDTGRVSWKQLADRVAVTWEDSHYAFGSAVQLNDFQVEIFFDGRIRITTLGVSESGGVVGISEGHGVPGDFVESDLLSYAACSICGDGVLEADEDCDDGSQNGTPTSCCTSGCTFVFAGSVCSDDSACTLFNSCDGAGQCSVGTPVTCDDGLSCTSDSCLPATGCEFVPVCEDSDPCTADACDEVLGCSNEPIPMCGEPPALVPALSPMKLIALGFAIVVVGGALAAPGVRRRGKGHRLIP